MCVCAGTPHTASPVAVHLPMDSQAPRVSAVVHRAAVSTGVCISLLTELSPDLWPRVGLLGHVAALFLVF